MRVECDDDGCTVVTDDGRVLAVFNQGSPATQRRHADLWVTGNFDRDDYEADIAADVGWTGQHVLRGG